MTSSSSSDESWFSDRVDVGTDEELCGITDLGELEDEVFLPNDYDADDESYATAMIIPAPLRRMPIPQANVYEWANAATTAPQSPPTNYDAMQGDYMDSVDPAGT